MIRRATVVLLMTMLSLMICLPAQARGCHGGGLSGGSTFGVGLTCTKPPVHEPGSASVVEAPAVPNAGAGIGACGAVATVDPTACQAPPAQPQVTPGAVAQAFQQIPVPQLTSITQPAGKTLVNFDTIFYVQAQPFDATVALLGQQVTLHVRPVSYTWDHGDGTTTTTAVPGAPYPRKQVLYRYQQAQTFSHRVSVTWAATFQVGNGPTADVPGTVTTTGPATPLRVVEATPVLTGDR